MKHHPRHIIIITNTTYVQYIYFCWLPYAARLPLTYCILKKIEKKGTPIPILCATFETW